MLALERRNGVRPLVNALWSDLCVVAAYIADLVFGSRTMECFPAFAQMTLYRLGIQ